MWVSAPEVERVKGPAEISEGEGQAAEGDVAIGARIAQALGFAGQVRGHFGQQIGFIKVEGSLNSSLSVRPRASSPGRPSSKTAVGWPLKVGALRDGDEDEAGLGGGRFERRDERGFEIRGHAR